MVAFALLAIDAETPTATAVANPIFQLRIVYSPLVDPVSPNQELTEDGRQYRFCRREMNST
jgi:hypothetical protein